MSDSLQGMVPELEEEHFSAFQDAFVIVAAVLRDASGPHELSGNLVGLSVESKSLVKIDLRVAVSDAYDVLSRYVDQDALQCDMCHLLLSNSVTRLEGPYGVSSVKIIDFDHQKKMCTLALDLVHT